MIEHEIKPKEKKPPNINKQRVVYFYKCGLCDGNYVGYTYRHLYQSVEKHKGPSSIRNHIKEQHGAVLIDICRDFNTRERSKVDLIA